MHEDHVINMYIFEQVYVLTGRWELNVFKYAMFTTCY